MARDKREISRVLIEPCGIETHRAVVDVVEIARVLIEPCGIETCNPLLEPKCRSEF